MSRRWFNFSKVLYTGLLATLAVASSVCALPANPPSETPVGATPAGQDRMEIATDKYLSDTQGVGLTQNLNTQIPLNLTFTDSTGKTVVLGDYFKSGKPVVLQMGYFGCPMLCGLVTEGMMKTVKNLELKMGTDYHVLYVSIDPRETPLLAHKKKQNFVTEYAKPGAEEGWHFLVGTEANSKALADAVGFGYKYIKEAEEYSHPAAIMILTPDGHVSRYLMGVDYPQQTLRWSLVEASNGKIGTLSDQIAMLCYHYDEVKGTYALGAMKLMRLGGLLTVLIGGAFLTRLYLRDYKAYKNIKTV